MLPSDVTVTHHFVDLPSLRMHYVEAGEGPVVLLLHGFPECWWSWRYQLKALPAAGFRVIAPDLRGYGETDKQGPYDLDTVTADVCHLIETLGGEKRVRVVGHDWGGAVAWHLASKRPEHCAKVAVLNCPHPQKMREALLVRPKLRQLRKSWYMFFFQLPLLAEYLLTRDDAAEVVKQLRGSAVDRTNFSEAELRPLRDAIQRPGAAAAMVGWYRAGITLKPPPVYPPITSEALLIWGKSDVALDYDVLVPGTERFAPRLRVEPIEHCGHFVQAEQPQKVNQLLLDFLR